MFAEIKQKSEPARQFMYNFSFSVLLWGIANGFYSIILFVLTDSLQLVFLDKLIVACATMVGIVIANKLLHRVGYDGVWRINRIFRTMYLAGLIVMWPMLEANPTELFWIVSVSMGLDSGLFHTSYHYVVVKQLSSRDRTYTLQLMGSFKTILGVVLPISIGIALDFWFGYRWLVVIAFVLSFLSLVRRYETNNKPLNNNGLLSKKFLTSFKKHKYSAHFLGIYFADTLQDELQAHFWKIAPFLIIGTLAGYGVFVGGVALLAAVVVYLRRNIELGKNLKLGYYLNGMRVLATLGLVIGWQTNVLVGRAIVEKSAQAIEKPIDDDLDSSLREAVLGDAIEANVMELNFLLEIIKFSVRVLGLGFFILLLTALKNDELFLRVVWGVVTFGGLLTYWLQVNLWRKVRKLT